MLNDGRLAAHLSPTIHNHYKFSIITCHIYFQAVVSLYMSVTTTDVPERPLSCGLPNRDINNTS
jgi:hypothetical protein